MRKQRCSYADKYQAIYAPKCGCEACWQKWEAKLRAKARQKAKVQK